MIYLDNAATSWPKPPSVADAVVRALGECGNPGRGGHPLALAAGHTVLDARESVAALLGTPDPAGIAFTRNTTEAINLALRGLLNPGDRVAVTPLEHNAVMRPLRELERRGDIAVTILPAAADGTVDLLAAESLLRGTRLLVAAHASNVLGTVQPLAELGELARSAGALFLVDGAQTAGSLPLDLSALPVDLFAFPGIRESLGMVYLEAQAAGLPVVAFDNGGIPEVMRQGETGILTPFLDVSAYRAAVVSLLDDADRRRAMGRAAMENVRTRHDAEVNFMQVDLHLRRLAGAHA